MTSCYVAFDPDMLHSPLPFGIQAKWRGSVGCAQGIPTPLIPSGTLTFYRLCGAPSRCASRGMLELLVELPRRPELREIVQPPWDAMSSVTTILGHYQKEGKLRGNAPWEAALTLLGPIVLVTALKTLAPLLSASIEPKEHVKQFLEGWECKEEEGKVERKQ